MLSLLIVVVIVLALINLFLVFSLCSLSFWVSDLSKRIKENIYEETNSLIGLKTGNRTVMRLNNEINKSLNLLNRERLMFQTKNNELKDTVTNISHDLRTPLTAILGYVDLLKEEHDRKKIKNYISIIRERVDTMVSLTDELFNYSFSANKEQYDKKSLVNLSSVLEESLASFYYQLKKRSIDVSVSFPEIKVERKLNLLMLRRILDNIIFNALKYSEGKLRIELKSNGEIVFLNRTTKLDQVTIEQIFSRFFTVENASSSHGLGLSIAKELTENMGGTIRADYSNENLSIYLFFPCREPC